MGQNTFSTINSLGELSFIGGTYYTLEFTVFDQDGSPLNLAGKTCTWAMTYFGMPSGNADYYVLVKTGTISGANLNVFTVVLDTVDTINLSGKFIHQPIISDITGAKYFPGQGILTILPSINQTASQLSNFSM